jgi:hypothetical protein
MIKFFRKIRQKLLSENKFSKYFIYAVGEIILVVIGILIALAINDSYQQRIDKVEEYSLLESLKEDFMETRVRAEKTLELQNKVVNYCNELERIMLNKNNTVSIDSVGIYLFSGSLSYYRIEPVTGTYDAIIGSGKIGLLQNKNLKRLLAEFSAEIEYGFEDENYSIDLTTLLTEKSSEYSYFLRPRYLKSVEFKNNEGQNAVEQHLKNDSFLGILSSKTVMENNRLNYQKDILNSINSILKIIESELEIK